MDVIRGRRGFECGAVYQYRTERQREKLDERTLRKGC
jgi:hypothetical protein